MSQMQERPDSDLKMCKYSNNLTSYLSSTNIQCVYIYTYIYAERWRERKKEFETFSLGTYTNGFEMKESP